MESKDGAQFFIAFWLLDVKILIPFYEKQLSRNFLKNGVLLVIISTEIK